jgi:pimeloyl-ACP methyl ester carboxylesterase
MAYQREGESIDLALYPAPGQLVDVGTFRLHLYCTGQGSPTVVVEAGGGAYSIEWERVQTEVSRERQICTYDHAGFGWSDVDRQPPTRQRRAETLKAALDRAHISGPYVLVGHSLGGLYAREFALRFPDTVAGMVLVDSSHENQLSRFPAALRDQQASAIQQAARSLNRCSIEARFGLVRAMGWMKQRAPAAAPPDVQAKVVASMNRTDYCKAYLDEMLTARADTDQSTSPHSLGDLPLVVLTAGNRGTPEDVNRLFLALHEELTALSSRGEHRVIEGAGHYIHIDRPEAVVEAIRHVAVAASNTQASAEL